MKGLDTPVLLALLRGEPRIAPLIRKLSGEEVCTTTVNVFELEMIALGDRGPGRDRRGAALDRLLRKVTVLPVDERSAKISAQEASKGGAPPGSPASWLVLGALIAGGCSEWITVREARFPNSSTVKVSFFDISNSKKPK